MTVVVHCHEADEGWIGEKENVDGMQLISDKHDKIQNEK